MWHWVRDLRRQKILEHPFPKEWDQIVVANVAHFERLDDRERTELRALIQIFVAEKHWEGCGGLELTDEIRVTIAAEACLMILALPHDVYRDVDTILVYPSPVLPPARRLGAFEIAREPIASPVPLLGEAHRRGPVILAWDVVKRTARHPESGHNVVYHELAHKLDMLDGQANGTPLLDEPGAYQRWAMVCEREFLRLRHASAHGERTFLDSYGATNEAEFFAVVTEQFFDQPTAMKQRHPELYALLQDFYRQDPAERERRLGS